MVGYLCILCICMYCTYSFVKNSLVKISTKILFKFMDILICVHLFMGWTKLRAIRACWVRLLRWEFIQGKKEDLKTFFFLVNILFFSFFSWSRSCFFFFFLLGQDLVFFLSFFS